MGQAKIDLLRNIEDATDEKTLIALALLCQGQAKSACIQPTDYADCMIALAKKLGFGITDKALAEAAAKYL